MERYIYAKPCLLIGLVSLLFACREREKDIVAAKSIIEVVSSNSEFSLLHSAILYSGMSDSLSRGTFTMFAPSDEAFEKINVRNASTIKTLPKDSVKKFVKHHLLPRKVSYTQLTTGQLKNLSNGMLLVTKDADEDRLLINRNRVIIPDINVSNGLIQVIDSVLVKLMYLFSSRHLRFGRLKD